jgi:hypothetical protein
MLAVQNFNNNYQSRSQTMGRQVSFGMSSLEALRVLHGIIPHAQNTSLTECEEAVRKVIYQGQASSDLTESAIELAGTLGKGAVRQWLIG